MSSSDNRASAPTALPFDAPDEGRIAAFRDTNLGRKLANANAAFETLVRSRLEAIGLIDDLSAVHLAAARSVDLDGTRMSDLADRVGISRQYVGTVVSDLRDAGIVKVEPDPADGRARLVKFTPAGRAGLLVGLEAIARITATTESAIGRERLEQLSRTLDEVRAIWTDLIDEGE